MRKVLSWLRLCFFFSVIIPNWDVSQSSNSPVSFLHTKCTLNKIINGTCITLEGRCVRCPLEIIWWWLLKFIAVHSLDTQAVHDMGFGYRARPVRHSQFFIICPTLTGQTVLIDIDRLTVNERYTILLKVQPPVRAWHGTRNTMLLDGVSSHCDRIFNVRDYSSKWCGLFVSLWHI